MGIDKKKRIIVYSNHVRSASMNGLDSYGADVPFLHAFRVLENAFIDEADINKIVWVVVSRLIGFLVRRSDPMLKPQSHPPSLF